MNLTKGIALFIGWLSGSLAGIGAILYAAGYLLTSAQLHMLGLSGLVVYGHDHYVQEGGRFLIAVAGLLGEIFLNLLIVGGFLALPVLLVLGPIAYWKRERLGLSEPDWLKTRLERLDRKWHGAWRVLAIIVLLALLFATSEDPQSFNAPLAISGLLFARETPLDGSLADLLLSGDSARLKAFFANSLLMELKAGTLALLAWHVAAPWRLRLLAASPFFLILFLYSLLLPMLYGVLQRQITLPVITLSVDTPWPGSDAAKLILLNKSDGAFVLWDVEAKKVLWLPSGAVKAAQIRQMEPLFASGATETGGEP